MPEYLPDRLEAGTHNVCGIAGLLEGLRFVERMTPERILRHERRLLQEVVRGLSGMDGVRLYTGQGQSGVLSLTVEGRDCEELGQELARRDVAVRGGLHCAPLAHESGGTLPDGTLRLSFSAFNTPQEGKRLVEICKKVFSKV
jgi:selenocysteine lyase/cysteine desulfurase